MVDFGGYSTPMDRGYGATHDHSDGDGHHHGGSMGVGTSTGDLGLGIGDLGFSFSLGPVPNVQAIAAKIRPGSKKIELAFTGTGKGTGQSQTPEYYGQKQRQALKEISTANRVDFSTHSTVGIAGLAGMDQQGNFSKASKNFSLQEVKRAVEFAADVGGGGPIVVHTGEFQRPIVDADWNLNKDDPYYKKFEMYSDEEDRSSFRVIDTRTGSVIQEARKSRKVARPVWKKYEKGDEYWDENDGSSYKDEEGKEVKEGDYIDYYGNKVEMAERVPVFDKEQDRFKIKLMDWKDLTEEAEELTKRARKFWRENKDENGETWKKDIWGRFREVKSEDEIEVKPEEAFIIATLETNAAHSRGWAVQYGGQFDQYVDRMKKLKEAKKFYEKLEDTIDPEEKWKLKRAARQFSDLVPEDSQFPTEIINDHIRQVRNSMEQSREAASSQWAQAEEAMEQIRHVESAETYAFREACDAYADLGVSAMRQSQKIKKEGRLKAPLAVAMENLFPEQYGAHPDELIKLVKGSRDIMKKKLLNLGVNREEAEQRSREHITATIDVGHMNTWRKYWKGDPKKTIDQNDKEFDKWMVDQVKKMAKADIIGHVHLDDNYGYHDDHLAPGEGNTPLREVVKVLKESGYKGELIVEPGADFSTDASGFHSVMKTWRHFNIPMSGSGVGSGPGGRRGWQDVSYGWFGQTQPPYFSFGGYSPSEDWTLWSGVPLE